MIRRHLALQLFLILLLASALPLVGAAALSLQRTEARIRAQVARDHAALAATSGTLIGSYLESARVKVEVISSVLLQQGRRGDEDLAQQLSALLLPSDEFLGLRYEDASAQGGQIAAVAQGVENQSRQIDQNLELGNFRGQTAVQAPEELAFNDPALRGVIETLAPGQTRLASQIALFNNGAFPLVRRLDDQRALSAELRLDPISRTLAELAQGSGRELVLLHPSGRVLAASSAEPHPEWLETRHDAPEGWTLLVREPEAAAYAPLADARRQTLVWSAAGAALAVLLSLVFARWLLRPIRRLTQAAEGLQRGELSTRVGLARGDEIGRLGASFDAMAEAFESLDRVKSEFVRTVSHELRTPLTAMKCAVENLIDGVGSAETLPRLRQDIDRLIRLVNDLLDLARLEAGASPLALQPTELSALVESCLASLSPLIAAKGIEVERSFTPGPTAGDPERLRQVVANLLDNAIKFVPAGGTITLEAAPGHLSVSDSGPGVPPERAGEVFEPFAAGGGVGLSIARKVVELHGGTIAVHGSRFVVALPAAPRLASAPRAPEPRSEVPA